MAKEKENVRKMLTVTESRSKEPQDHGREPGRCGESLPLPKGICSLEKD